MKRIDYCGKVAIVTGVTSGLGREIACELIKKYGCVVYGVARSVKKLEAMREELGPDKFMCCCMDVSDRKSWEKLRIYFENTDTSPHILINCAGVLPKFASVEGTDIEAFESVMEINYLSCVYGCKIIMPIMKAGGAVVNVSSASALCTFAGIGAYSASKAALERFTESLSVERRDISVSCVMPGFIKTNIMASHDVNEKEKSLIDRFSSDPYKVAKKVIKRAGKRKRRIVIGADAHLMSGMFRLFPTLTPKIISWFLRKTKMEMFNKI